MSANLCNDLLIAKNNYQGCGNYSKSTHKELNQILNLYSAKSFAAAVYFFIFN